MYNLNIFRLALAAITRIDLSNNQLSNIPIVLFQLQSLRILNLDQNCISQINFLSSNLSECAQALCLENLSLAGNYIDELPVQLFMAQYFPSLKVLNVGGNRLKYLPSVVWLAPRLRELNAMNNEIVELRTRVDRRDNNRGREDYATRNQRLFYQKRHQSSQHFRAKQQLGHEIFHKNAQQESDVLNVVLTSNIKNISHENVKEKDKSRGRDRERTSRHKSSSSKTSKMSRSYSEEDRLKFDETNIIDMDITR